MMYLSFHGGPADYARSYPQKGDIMDDLVFRAGGCARVERLFAKRQVS